MYVTQLRKEFKNEGFAGQNILFGKTLTIWQKYIIQQTLYILGSLCYIKSRLEQRLQIIWIIKSENDYGGGFSFAARQKRITFNGRHNRIDLVFYNYILKCFVLMDLKIGDLIDQDLGQMYVHYHERELMNEGDNLPIGIVLYTDKSESAVKYALPENKTQIFASK